MKQKKNMECFAWNNSPDIKKFDKNVKSFSLIEGKPPQGCVWIYSDCCYTHERLEICGDFDNFESIYFDNVISSVKFGPGVQRVILYINPNYKGLAYSLTEDSTCLDQGETAPFYKQISSIQIIPKTK
jgi:hypothetical protein